MIETQIIKKCLVSDEDLKKINAFSRRELSANEVFIFTAVLCDNDIDRDFERFSDKSLYTLAELFKGKTGISDHSMKSADQRARIFDTFVERADGMKTLDSKPLYQLKAKAYMLRSDENKSLIDEIEAGIKKEVSVSCSMGSSICSVCGADTKKGRCGHIRGREYDGSVCFNTLENALDAYEFSFVAVPAQRGAGVTKAFDKTGTQEIDMNDIKDTVKGCSDEGLTLSKKQADRLYSYIEELEDTACLGEEYKKELSKEVIALFAKHFPAVDKKLFASVTAVMTASELKGFRQGLKNSTAAPALQLGESKSEKAEKDFTEFKI